MSRRMNAYREPNALRRWLRFNMVGLIGVFVQLAILQLLITAWRIDYKYATLLAVEAAVLNNFWWHVRYTWRERRLRTGGVIARRLAEFHLTNGLVSLAGSWTLMSLLVGRARVPVIVANMVSIVACSLVNFMLAEVLVFRTAGALRAGRMRSLQLPNISRGEQDTAAFGLRSSCMER